jgi:hypothetical protein
MAAVIVVRVCAISYHLQAMKSDQRDLLGILRAHWTSLLPMAALILAVIFLPARIIGSPLFFPIVSFLLIGPTSLCGLENRTSLLEDTSLLGPNDPPNLP